MQVKFDVYFKRNLGTLCKSNEVDLDGKEANLNIDLSLVSKLEANYKVGDLKYTDEVLITDLENNSVMIPFKSDVVKVGLNEFEVVAYMVNGDVKTSQTYTYEVAESIGVGISTGGGSSSDGHSHLNLTILNAITQADINNWNGKANGNHTHTGYANVAHNHSDLYYDKATVDNKIANIGSGESVDLSNYYTKSETNDLLGNKSDKFYVDSADTVLGDKITTLNGRVDNHMANHPDGEGVIFKDVEEGEIFEVDDSILDVGVDGISLNKATTIVPKGSTETLIATISPLNATNKKVTWSSSNTSIASVNNGVVSGVENGNAVITVTTVDGGFTATCNVVIETVAIPVVSVSLDKASHIFKVDETLQLNATVLPTNANNRTVTWSSSDISKATVVNGLVTARAEGGCVITVSTVDGDKIDTCNLTINAKEVAPPSDANVIYEEDGYLCVPVDIMTFKHIAAYVGDFKLYDIAGNIFSGANSLIDKSTLDLNILLKDVTNLNIIPWDTAINSNDLTEGFAVREGHYIVLKIPNSNIGNKDVRQYYKENYGEIIKFKLKSNVHRINVLPNSFGAFSTRAATIEGGQYAKVVYNSDVKCERTSRCSYGFAMGEPYPWSAPMENINLKTTSLEFLFQNKLAEITLDELKEYINVNPLTIWI